jgi:CspA family cold shock protein
MIRKDKGFRGPRRRGFDDDWGFVPDSGSSSSRPPPRPSSGFTRDPAPADGPTVDATVKWFKADKGFGFVELADGTGDAFLHVGALQSAGHDSVAAGAKLKVVVGQGAKGRQVTRVLEVDDSGAGAGAAPDRGGSGGASRGVARPPRRPADTGSAAEMAGTVKWFNESKGFGFIAGEDGGKDVFIHASVLGTAGLTRLAEGQRVSMRVVDTPKGREAVSIALEG